MVKPTTSSAPDTNSDAKFTGVRKRKWGKWVSEIRLPNSRQRIWLGSYDTPQKAARAFDAALFCLRGSTARFNFPHQPPDIPGGRSLPPSQIQAAAARFANANCTNTPTTHDHSSSPSPSPSSSSCNTHSDQLNQTDQGESWTSQLDLTSPFLHDFTDYLNLNNNTSNNTGGVPDFGIYPGFDDYFMPSPPATTDDYGHEQAENYDGIILQGPSFLWNF
ncbi:ethylene-responsive transcription factor ERF017-like [Cynara cardunculus var. scolymus]|uniref:AP2/ERF domain-containing protein n=1 Tax=Cynara cardunculus var. scolymus TaxID=59895 RepID=A0A103XNZ1_CYNCS|nr:ethylene-responsive transcription factor ERF017-like [Cynara cardunculus var. scolymus]KVH94049.1 AP2/ERF domain-containing protein [Cynara cardunculus var. scolymus]